MSTAGVIFPKCKILLFGDFRLASRLTFDAKFVEDHPNPFPGQLTSLAARVNPRQGRPPLDASSERRNVEVIDASATAKAAERQALN